jgi:hypothetical protein
MKSTFYKLLFSVLVFLLVGNNSNLSSASFDSLSQLSIKSETLAPSCTTDSYINFINTDAPIHFFSKHLNVEFFLEPIIENIEDDDVNVAKKNLAKTQKSSSIFHPIAINNNCTNVCTSLCHTTFSSDNTHRYLHYKEFRI